MEPRRSLAVVCLFFGDKRDIEPGIHRGIIRELAFRGDLPLPPAPASNKRERNTDSPTSQTLPSSPGSPGSLTLPSMPSFSLARQVPADAMLRPIAGSRRANRTSQQQREHGQHPQQCHQELEPTSLRLPAHTTELGKPRTYSNDMSSMYWFQDGSLPASSSVGGGSTFQGRQTFGEDMGISRGDSGVSSAYPVVSGAMECEQPEAAARREMGSNRPLGSAGELRGHAYSPKQNQPAIVPSSSSFHFSTGFFDSPGFGGGGRAAPAPVSSPVGGGYQGGGLMGSGGMDADLQALMNVDMVEVWSNYPWEIFRDPESFS